MSINEIIQRATHAYVAFAPCGCWSAVTTDLGDSGNKDLASGTADDVADFIRSGLQVKRITIAEWRNGLLIPITSCPHKGRTEPSE